MMRKTLSVAETAPQGIPETRRSRSFASLAGRRILLIAPQPFFANRGTPFNVRAMVEALAAAGCKVDLLVFPHGEAIELPSGVRVLRSPGIPGIRDVKIGPSWAKILLDIPLSLAALWHALRGSYDAFHGVEEGGIIAGVVASLRRKPYVYDMDSCMPQQLAASGFFRSRLLLGAIEKLENYFIKNAGAVLTVCEALTEKAVSIAGDTPIHQIEDCPVASEPRENVMAAIRLQFGLSDKRVFLYTGNLESYQGIDLLLEGFATFCASKEHPDTCLLIVGGTEEKIAHYRERARELGIAEETLFAGERPPEEMGSFMAVADALLSPRITGGNTPLKLYSYMAAERIIVASDISSHTQVLDDSNALLFQADPDSLAEALEKASESDALAIRAMVANAKDLVEERFSRTAFDRRVVAVYERLFS